MDIYFCDLCASRVTAQDLRAGKGMRRRHDIICGSCIDLGKAQEWMAHTGPSVPVSQLEPRSPASAPVDPIAVGRDRARTEHEPSPHNDETSRVQTLAPQLAMAATGMTALSPNQAESRDSADDLSELSESEQKQETGMHPAQDQVQPAASPFTEPAPEKADKAAGAKPASSSSQKAKSGSTSRVTPRPVPAKSGKSSRRAAVQGIPPQVLWIGSAISLVLILVIAGLVINKKMRPKHVGGETIVISLTSEIKALAKAADKANSEAMNGGDVAACDRALKAQRDLRACSERFEAEALKAGWKQDNVEYFMETSVSPSLSAFKSVNDRRAILLQQH